MHRHTQTADAAEPDMRRNSPIMQMRMVASG
jgi:hypothetical protein